MTSSAMRSMRCICSMTSLNCFSIEALVAELRVSISSARTFSRRAAISRPRPSCSSSDPSQELLEPFGLFAKFSAQSVRCAPLRPPAHAAWNRGRPGARARACRRRGPCRTARAAARASSAAPETTKPSTAVLGRQVSRSVFRRPAPVGRAALQVAWRRFGVRSPGLHQPAPRSETKYSGPKRPRRFSATRRPLRM